jgi:hypothetical protein
LQESDLNDAQTVLTDKILESAKAEFEQQIDTTVFNGSKYSIEVVERVADYQPGEEVGSFTISLTLNVTGVFFDLKAIEDYAKADLQTRISENYNLDSISEDGVQIEVKSADNEKQSATLGVYIDGMAVISESSDVLDKDRLIGRSPSEVITILEASELIDKVSVEFTPFWLKRVPTLKDHIKIIVE